jgi:hypothetical protein
MNSRWRQLVKLKSTSVIPKGMYCYNDGWDCPYWSRDKRLPKMENGYCKYLGKSDWDINEESDTKHGGWDVWDAREKKCVGKVSAHKCYGSLLFDMCKECGINKNAK